MWPRKLYAQHDLPTILAAFASDDFVLNKPILDCNTGLLHKWGASRSERARGDVALFGGSWPRHME